MGAEDMSGCEETLVTHEHVESDSGHQEAMVATTSDEDEVTLDDLEAERAELEYDIYILTETLSFQEQLEADSTSNADKSEEEEEEAAEDTAGFITGADFEGI